MELQLREYRIEEGRLDDFVREWRERVLPLRIARGFRVLGPWIERAESRFVCVVGYDGDMRRADAAYYASSERSALNPDPARLVVETRHVWLEEP